MDIAMIEIDPAIIERADKQTLDFPTLAQLKVSLKTQGQLEPIIVRALTPEEQNRSKEGKKQLLRAEVKNKQAELLKLKTKFVFGEQSEMVLSKKLRLAKEIDNIQRQINKVQAASWGIVDGHVRYQAAKALKWLQIAAEVAK